MISLLQIALLCVIASTATCEELLPKAHVHFRRFMADFGRQYADDNETRMRFDIFQRNLHRIDQLNAANPNAVFGITKFTDLTDEERRSYTGYRPSNSTFAENNCHQSDGSELRKETPDSWDWRDKNVVTKVKNQWNCLSCWTFSATGNLEGQYAIKNGQLLEFSEQQLMNCYPGANCGHGGDMANAIVFWHTEGGAMSEQDYPYLGHDQTCEFDASKVKTSVKGCTRYKPKSEDDLKEILYTQGPLAIAIDSNGFTDYHGGIIQNSSNDNWIDHGVLLVGFGKEKGIPYWIIKNSWGEEFGEKGYARAERGTNQLGIMNEEDGEIVTAIL